MPAHTSSRIDPALGHLLAVVEPFADDRVGLLTVLAQIPDPRKARGIRHQFQAVLALAVCAVLAGARSYVAIGEWAADADVLTLSEVGAGTVVPCETTFRRTLQSLDADVLDDRLGAWAGERTRPAAGSRRRVGVDGKTLRGSACDGAPGRHLLAALDHTHGVVLGQVDVQAKTNELPLFSTLLDRIELTDAIVTADAIHAQRAHAEYLVEQRQAHYVLTVKRNQPHLHDQLKALPWAQIPTGYDARERGHGRDEWRTLKVTALAAGLDFPHAVQALGSSMAGASASGSSAAANRSPPARARTNDAPAKPSTRSPRWPRSRSAPKTWPTSCEGTGSSRTACTGSVLQG